MKSIDKENINIFLSMPTFFPFIKHVIYYIHVYKVTNQQMVFGLKASTCKVMAKVFTIRGSNSSDKERCESTTFIGINSSW